MRVLILSISKRSGHQSAAVAVENSFHQYYPAIDIINCNFFDLINNPKMEKMVSSTYMSILKTTPELWDYLYDNQKVIERMEGLRKFIDRKNSAKFKQVVEQLKPSVVVCTQAFPCEVTAVLKRDGRIDVPLVAVVTDFIAHAYWVHDEIDLYTVPSEKTMENLVNRGIHEQKIEILGIPIDSKFENIFTPKEKNDLMIKLNLNPQLPVLLIMGGSQGLGPIQNIIKSFNSSKNRFQVIVVTGTNNKLRRELNQLKLDLKFPMPVYGYINNIHELMSISDILITKPGGMTSTEALVKRLPMIIIRPLPGQEEKNSQFLVNSGAAIRVDDEEFVVEKVDFLLSDKERLYKIKRCMDELVIHDSSRRIAESIVRLISDREVERLVYA